VRRVAVIFGVLIFLSATGAMTLLSFLFTAFCKHASKLPAGRGGAHHRE